jgi:hypothetical protein
MLKFAAFQERSPRPRRARGGWPRFEWVSADPGVAIDGTLVSIHILVTGTG